MTEVNGGAISNSWLSNARNSLTEAKKKLESELRKDPENKDAQKTLAKVNDLFQRLEDGRTSYLDKGLAKSIVNDMNGSPLLRMAFRVVATVLFPPLIFAPSSYFSGGSRDTTLWLSIKEGLEEQSTAQNIKETIKDIKSR